MHNGLLPTVAIVGMVVVAVMFILEVRRWRVQGPATGRAHRLLRVWIVVLIESLFALMIVGPAITGLRNPITALIYWTVCLGIGLAVVVLALIDFRNVIDQYARLHRGLFRDLTSDDEHKH